MQCTKFNTNNKNKRHISEIKIQLSEDSSKTQSLKKINKQLHWENVKEMKMIKLTIIQNKPVFVMITCWIILSSLSLPLCQSVCLSTEEKQK